MCLKYPLQLKISIFEFNLMNFWSALSLKSIFDILVVYLQIVSAIEAQTKEKSKENSQNQWFY